jgi:hypothetical protein
MIESLLLILLSITSIIYSAEVNTLEGSDVVSGDYFGSSTAISGDYAIVGTYPEVSNGAAYIFKRNADGSWTEDRKLTAGSSVHFEEFGYSVDIDGNYCVAGSPGYNNSDGRAFIYQLVNGVWSLQQTIELPSGTGVKNFGEIVVIKGAYLLVSAAYSSSSSSDNGKVFLYKLNNNTWSLIKTFEAPAGISVDAKYGLLISMSDNYIIIGATEAGSGQNGECYIYTKNNDNWDLTGTLAAPADFSNFGVYISNTDTYAAITGVNGEDLMNGNVFIYQNNAGTWTNVQQIQSSSPNNNMFGYSICLNDNLLAIADPMNNFRGAVYTYKQSNNQWSLDQTYKTTEGSFPGFGFSIDLESNNYLICGDPYVSLQKGVAYVYGLNQSFITIAVSPENGGTTEPSANSQHEVTTNQAFQIKATAATGYEFNSWEVTSGTVAIQDTQSASTTATVNGIGQITANFVKVAKVAFSVFPENTGTTNPDGTQNVAIGTRLPIRAIPSSGYYFDQWTISGSAVIDSSISSQTTVLINGDSTITAVFKPFVKEVQLTMVLSPEAGGSITPTSGTHVVESSKLFPIEATPANGMHFVTWVIDGPGVISNPSASSTSASITGNATITAYFAENATDANLTMAANPSNSGTTEPAVGTTAVSINRPVRIEAYPATGYYFDNWTISGQGRIDGSENTIAWVTLAADATVTANFSANPEKAILTMAVTPAGSGTSNPGIGNHTVNLGELFEIEASPASGYYFVKWTNSGSATISDPELSATMAKLSGNAIITAEFAPVSEPVTMTISSSPEGGGATNPGKGEHQLYSGSSIKIEAFPASGYYFKNWSSVGSSVIEDADNAETVVTLYGNSTITANFVAATSTATLAMQVSPDNSGYTNPGSGSHTVVIGNNYEINAIPGSNYVFDKWVTSGSVVIENPEISHTEIVLSGNATVSAVFTDHQGDASLLLDVTPANSGTTNPGSGVQSIPIGQRTKIEAIPASGYYFSSWEAGKNVIVEDLYAKETNIELLGNSTLTATFSAVTTTAGLTLTVSPENSGNTNPGIGSHTINISEKVKIEAIANNGYHFVRWSLNSGTASISNIYDSETYVTIESAATVTANFATNDTDVTVEMKVLPESSGYTNPGIGTHNGLYAGQIICLKAYPADGYHFVNWSTDEGATVSNSLAAETTASLSSNAVIAANFAMNENPVSLIVKNSDAGGGIIYPAPGSYTLYAGQSIKLEAAPLTGYYFIKWELDGKGYIDDDKSQVAYAKISENSSITAVFSTQKAMFLSYGSVLSVDISEYEESRKWLYATLFNTTKQDAEPRKLQFGNIVHDATTQVLTGQWRHYTQLYDKKDYPKKEKLSELLIENPIKDLKLYAVYLSSRGEKPVNLGLNAYVTGPIVDSVSGDYSEKGDVFTVVGRYFGSKTPTVELEYMKNNRCHYKKCKVDKTASLKYQNALGLDNKSCMKILESDPTDQQAVNYSQVVVSYPKLNDQAEPTGYIIVKNKSGMTAFKLK